MGTAVEVVVEMCQAHQLEKGRDRQVYGELFQIHQLVNGVCHVDVGFFQCLLMVCEIGGVLYDDFYPTYLHLNDLILLIGLLVPGEPLGCSLYLKQ